MHAGAILEIVHPPFTGDAHPDDSSSRLDDWLLLYPDGVLALNCRMVLETDDGHCISMTYTGRRHGPPEVIERMNRGEEVEASEYYHRVTPYFETDSEAYDWLNGVVAIGVGHKQSWGGLYSIHQVI
jgi:hypothetical protein